MLRAGALLIGLLITSGLVSGQPREATALFSLLKESTLLVDGTTNINQFTCVLDGKDDRDVFPTATIHNQYLAFKDAVLIFEVNDFDCGPKPITRDFRKALRSKTHPELFFEIININAPLDRLREDGLVETDVRLTIAGESRELKLDLHKKKTEAAVLYAGEQKLRMSDFGINPPQALWGAIRANDEIDITFEIFLRTESSSRE